MKTINYINYEEVVNAELLQGNIDNNEFHGFLEDYRVLHCLLRKYNPKSVFEIGCNMGTGTKIIKNAVMEAEVFSLDLPTELAHTSLQHPLMEGKGDYVGIKCDLPFTLLRGDSMVFDFSKYPCEAAFVDGEHDRGHPKRETIELIKNCTKLIVYHDSDITDVMNGILDAFEGDIHYNLYRVNGTRIAFAVLKENE